MQDARAAQPVDERLHLAARQPHVAAHDDRAAPAARGACTTRSNAAVAGVDDDQRRAPRRARDAPRDPGARAALPLAPGFTRARRKFFSDGALTLMPPVSRAAAPRARIALAESGPPTSPIEPAPSVMTRSPVRASAATAAGTSSSACTTWTGHDAGRADRRGERLDGHAGNRRLAGRVDVGQHDLVGAPSAAPNSSQQIARARSTDAAETRRRRGGRCPARAAAMTAAISVGWWP